MGRSIGAAVQQPTITNLEPIGSLVDVFRSGDAYKAVGELVQRSAYPALSAAFPRTGAVDTLAIPLSSVEIHGYASGAGVTIAVGTVPSSTTNTILISYDGREWFIVTSGVNANWAAVTFANGLFVAISNTGKVITSPDGITWTARADMPVGVWAGIAFGSGKFVAVANGSGAQSAYTTDFVTWTVRALPTTSNWVDVIFAGGQFLAVASSANAGATSPDGITWTARTLPTASGVVGRIVYGLGRYVLTATGGQIYSSADGVNWTTYISGLSSLQCAAFGNGVFIVFSAVPTGTLLVSYDGLTWNRRAIGSATAIAGTGSAGYFAGAFTIMTPTAGLVVFAENLTDSDYLYLRGTAGKKVRVK